MRNHITSWAQGLILCSLLLQGCSSTGTIFRKAEFSNRHAEALSIDARQRVVLSNMHRSNSTAPSQTAGETSSSLSMRLCSEPAPDVFMALASSVGAEINATYNADKSASLLGKLSRTMSENAATIERSQTVNILREVMYRNCERYLSDAISEDEFIVQAARDHKLIIQVLAIEQITGVSRAQSAALLTMAQATAGGVSDRAIEAYSTARKERDAKRANSDKLSQEAADLEPKGACTAKDIDLESLPDDVTEEQAKAKNAKCAESKAANRETKEAQDNFDTLQKALANQPSTGSQTQAQFFSAASQNAAATEMIAKIVLDIVKQNNEFDEMGMTCVIKARSKEGLPLEMRDFCLPLLEDLSTQSQLRIKGALNRLEDQSSANLNAVWTHIQGEPRREEALQRLLTASGLKRLPREAQQAMLSAQDKDSFARAFRQLGSVQQNMLANATSAPAAKQ